MSRHAAAPPPSFRETWREAHALVRAGQAPPVVWVQRRWVLLLFTVTGMVLILAFPASFIGDCIAVAGAAALLGEVFRW